MKKSILAIGIVALFIGIAFLPLATSLPINIREIEKRTADNVDCGCHDLDNNKPIQYLICKGIDIILGNIIIGKSLFDKNGYLTIFGAIIVIPLVSLYFILGLFFQCSWAVFP